MNTTHSIEIVLDLRKYKKRHVKAQDYLKLWSGLEPALLGQQLTYNHQYKLQDSNGIVGITMIAQSTLNSPIDSKTKFAVHAVKEMPKQVYFPFRCSHCREKLSDDNAYFLDGNMLAFCKEHLPSCKGSGVQATFWCDGPICKRKVAWSDRYRKVHPGSQDYNFCPDCYAKKYPPCTIAGCEDTGTNGCEYVNPQTGKACGNAVCNRHVKKWQIYGPHKSGIALCSEHKHVRRLQDDQILFQMIAATANRSLRSRKRWWKLPSLQSFGHIFLNTRDKRYDLHSLSSQIENATRSLGEGRLHKEMKKIVREGKQNRARDLARAASESEVGQKHFDRLKNLLVQKGWADLANALRYSDFKPKRQWLFVDCEPDYRGRLIGRGGSTIKALSAELGIQIKTERGN